MQYEDGTAQINTLRLHPAQQQILDNSRRFNVCSLGRRSGKTYLGTRIVLKTPRGNGVLHGHPVGWYAPTSRHMIEVWNHLCQTLKPLIVQKSERYKRLDLVNGGSIECWSLDDKNAGRSRKQAVAIFDEAAMVRDLEYVFENSVRPLLADYKGEAWFLSTPRGINYFKTLFDKGTPGSPDYNPNWASFQMPTWVNPFIDPEEIEDLRRGMHQLQFQEEIEAQFLDITGALVKNEYIRTGHPPEDLLLYMGVDLAISKKENADYTAISLIGIDQEGRVWIVYCDRRRVSFREAVEWIKHIAARHRPVKIGIEDVQYQAALIQELQETTNLPIHGLKPRGDKLTRASGLIARYERGLVYHSETLSQDYLREILTFSANNEHDDMVDATVYAYMLSGDTGGSARFEFFDVPSRVIDDKPGDSKLIPENFPGLPQHIVSFMLEHTTTRTCGACQSFDQKTNLCEAKLLHTTGKLPACEFFLEKDHG